MATRFDPATFRSTFPALRRRVAGRPAVYLDGPGGTQVPEMVISAMATYLRAGGSNVGGAFASSLESEAVVDAARAAMADLVGGRPEEIVFGPNMTSLTFSMSRALARQWGPGDRVVVTGLDHDANVTPWVLAAADAGAEVAFADLDPSDCSVDVDHLVSLLDERTRLVAVTRASNAFGTVVDVAAVAEAAHRVGAHVYVDGVHYTPHGFVDVAALGCDYYVCSGYKFFGPHVGALWGREELLSSVEPYRVRPAPARHPGKFETGTLSFEALAGLGAAVDYLASIGAAAGDTGDRRSRLRSGMEQVAEHERALAERFLGALDGLPGIRLYGAGVAGEGRVPTFAVDVAGRTAGEVSAELGRRGIFTWAGHYYAWEPMRRLGLLDGGGLVRIGFVHTTTPAEVDRLLGALGDLTSS